MTEQEFADRLAAGWVDGEGLYGQGIEIGECHTFEEEGLLTSNAGVVLTLFDGYASEPESEVYQITVVRVS